MLAALMCLLLAYPATAQSWQRHSFSSEDGLPANNLYGLIRDTRGFIWVSSEAGVASFDGNRFRSYTVAQGLPDNEVTAMSVDKEGRVWAFPYHEPPVYFNWLTDRFEKANAQTRPPELIRETRLGNAVFSCDTNGIYKRLLAGVEKKQVFHRNLKLHAAHLVATGKGLALINDNGTAAWLIDTATLELRTELPLDGALASDILDDGEGHFWISTLGQGLIRLSRAPGFNYQAILPPGMTPAAIAIDGDVLLCGDNRGRIAIVKKGCVESLINIYKWSQAVARIRNILVLKDGYYVAVEGDASLLLDKKHEIVSLFNRPLLNHTDRCAALLNDSVILAGSHTAAQKLFYRMCETKDAVPIRTTAIGADIKRRTLVGSTDGLHRVDDTGLTFLGVNNPALRGRVSAICTTADGLTWVGFADNYVVALEEDKPIATLRFGVELRGKVCNALCAGRSGELWIGTDNYLNRVRYTYTSGKLSWEGVAFGTPEGIAGSVNGLAWQRDSIYIAGADGVSVLPCSCSPAIKDVPVFITGIRINDRDTALQQQWELPHQMNDLDISFAGIDLDGFGPVYQYAVNGEGWQELSGDHLVLNRLQPGSYQIRIRALRRDGKPSASGATLTIKLHAPFWRTTWFRVLAGLLALGGATVLLQFLSRRKRKRQLQRITSEHELVTSQQQTFAALMNPHFIFNALNSIQHYVLVQDKRSANKYLSGFGRLIRMNFESAQKSFISLEEEIERLQLYLSLEQMRFGEKLRYNINVAEDLLADEWQIPAMIIQPYVENALLHGISPSAQQGLLEVSFSVKENALLVQIIDNGIGMKAASEARSSRNHRSSSMQLIERRIAVLRKLRRSNVQVDITAANPSDLRHPGTAVSILFRQYP